MKIIKSNKAKNSTVKKAQQVFTTKVKVSLYGQDDGQGLWIENYTQEVDIQFELDMDMRSWGIKDILLNPMGVVELEYYVLDRHGELVNSPTVQIDLKRLQIEMNPGSSFTFSALDITLDAMGNVIYEKSTLEGFFISMT